MTQYQAFRRQSVPGQVAQQLQTTTLPAPVRGIVLSENYTFMQPGGAIQLDNWKPTLRGLSLRGGCIRWCDIYDNGVDPPPPVGNPSRLPIISAFEYASGNSQRMFAANANTLYDVTFSGAPTVVQAGQASGNYCASQLANQGGDFMIALNDAGDTPLRFDGTSWTVLDADQINGPADTTVQHGKNLTYVWKYRNRWFFIEGGTMNAWYLDTNAIQGTLQMIPLSGAATKGGKLLFGAAWTVASGSGLDDKCVFVTDQGECLIFTGTNPSDAANWSQQGRYAIAPAMGMNAHISLGGDLLIATVDGIVPISAAMTKDAGQLELAMITQNIRETFRNEALAKNNWAWTMERWDEYGGMFVTTPGGVPGQRYCYVVNTGTGAWARFVGWDVTCFIRMRGDMFFGTQDGFVMQADRTGYDDGMPYTAIMVGGWEMFQSPSQSVTWRQSRASFIARAGEPFNPQISAGTDYLVVLPPPPPPGPDPGVGDLWDEGLWDEALWDHGATRLPSVRNTGWVSVGATGYSHAPILQVTVAQQAPPQVELVSIAATFDKLGVNV